jgi:hypothetical protein
VSLKFATRLKLILLIGGALLVCKPGWSDAGIPGPTPTAAKMCYCECDAAAGSAACTHMCDLAKYENREWATSCHKKSKEEAEPDSTTPASHSSRDNGVQQVRR